MSDVADIRSNMLLATLSAVDLDRLFLHLEPMRLLREQTIHHPGVAQRHVYFPIDCVVSLQTVLSDGSSDEIAIVGNEGVVGVAVIMGNESAPSRALVRRAGRAWRIKAECLRLEFQRTSELHLALLRYSHSLLTQIAQTAVCNRHHTLDQQLCRWLLMSLDRLPSNKLTMTQEQIANMLGVRRERVTEAAGKLQRAGAIQYSRGRIDVLDRHKLEESACECYKVVSGECSRRLRPPRSIAVSAAERPRQERPFLLVKA